MRNAVAVSRFIVLLAVVGSFIIALALMFASLGSSIGLAGKLFNLEMTAKATKLLAIEAIKLIDLFLLATVFVIISLGLYELFIDEKLDLPPWLVVRSLDDLKAKLIGVVIVVMGVFFLEQVIAWTDEIDLLKLGLPVALVIAALTYFLNAKAH